MSSRNFSRHRYSLTFKKATKAVKEALTFISLTITLTFLYACNDESVNHHFDEGNPPQLISEWNLFQLKKNQLTLSDGNIPYDLNTPLFSDYASKFRTLWIPKDTRIQFNKDTDYTFPDGTIISKTFYYRKAKEAAHSSNISLVHSTIQSETLSLKTNRLIETRLLVKKNNYWFAYPYIWDDQQVNARLAREGDFINLFISDSKSEKTFSYLVPDINQCAGCHAEDHTSGKLKPIGVKTRHINRKYNYNKGNFNQLAYWESLGYLEGYDPTEDLPRNANWNNFRTNAQSQSRPESVKVDGKQLEHQARSYLDINCAHCHNPKGAADTSGLHLNKDNISDRTIGICKPPIAAGRGSGGYTFSITPGNANESIIVHRVNSSDPAVMMPELGRVLIHREGVNLLSNWISALKGTCG